jgi:hypothetical protein
MTADTKSVQTAIERVLACVDLPILLRFHCLNDNLALGFGKRRGALRVGIAICQVRESNHGQIGWVGCQFGFGRYPESYPGFRILRITLALCSASSGVRSGIEPPTFGG